MAFQLSRKAQEPQDFLAQTGGAIVGLICFIVISFVQLYPERIF